VGIAKKELEGYLNSHLILFDLKLPLLAIFGRVPVDDGGGNHGREGNLR
jgi:hypothetical protein